MSISLDKATLEAALVGYQQHLQQIESKMADLRRMLGQAPASAPAAKRARKTAGKQKHRMSPEGRARIAAAQRARWAKAKKAQDEATLANARIDLDRYTKLAASNSGSKQQADTQKALVAQLEAQVQLRTAEQKQAGAAYAQLALKAFNEVETALASESSLAAREQVLRQGLGDSRRALELEQVRFRVGSKDLRSVTQQQLAAYAVSMSLLRVQTEQRVQRVQLHLALGGDFAPADS